MQSKKLIKFNEAIDETFLEIFKKNKNSIIIGLGSNDPKSIFGTQEKVKKKYPDRVLDMPLSENSMTGIIIGAALNGIKPILVHQRLDFALLSMEQIINQAAKWNYMFDGKKNVPIIIRMIVGRGWGQGPQHSQSLQSIFAHIPGLKVVMPSTVESAQHLLFDSFHDKNPTIFIEHRWLHNLDGKKIQNLKANPLGKSKFLSKGKKLTIIASSYMTIEILRIQKETKDLDLSLEIIDLQSISPIDENSIIKSVRKTGNCLILDTGHEKFGVSSEILKIIVNKCFNHLKKKPEIIANPFIPVPTSFAISKYYYPNKYQITKKIFEMLNISLLKIPKSLKDYDYFGDQPHLHFKGPF